MVDGGGDDGVRCAQSECENESVYLAMDHLQFAFFLSCLVSRSISLHVVLVFHFPSPSLETVTFTVRVRGHCMAVDDGVCESSQLAAATRIQNMPKQCEL